MITTNTLKRATVSALLCIQSAAVACGGDGPASGTGGGSTSSSTGGAGLGAGGAAACEPTDCSDGFDCTIDVCNDGACTHTIGPNQGATACPPREYCTLDTGCIAAPACTSISDCTDAWAGDACKTDVDCDQAAAVCTFTPLDKDLDGHSPQICGGDDCDDTEPRRYLGKTEVPDKIDNDCDGTVDDNAVCPHCAEWLLDRLVGPDKYGALCGNAQEAGCGPFGSIEGNTQLSNFLACAFDGCSPGGSGPCGAFFQGAGCTPIDSTCFTCIETTCANELLACQADKLPDAT